MGHIQRILVPMDGSPCSIAGLLQAVTLAEDLGAELEAVHVNAPDELAVGSTTGAARAAADEEEREMEDAIEAAKHRLGTRMQRRVESGEPVRKILDIATEDGADLIVIGTHGRVGRLHALVGSVAEGVMRSAPCPVLTVRCEGGEAESFAERIHRRDSMASQARPSR